MGSIFGGGKSGGFQAKGPSQAQVSTAYNQSQDSIAQQRNFVQQLQAQNGLGNQQNVFAQQQALANQLQGVANGTGPNPALAELNQQTGNNAAQQSALMAGQRGAAQNAGLIARQAAQQGGNLQQQAVGQEATLQAQQQLAAMGQLQGQQASMANVANTQVGQAQQGLTNYGQQTAQQYGTLVGQQNATNQINAQMAQQRAASENSLIGNITGALGTAAGMAFAGPIGGAAAGALTSKLGGQAGGMDRHSSYSSPEEAQMNAATGGMITPDKVIAPSGPRSKAAQHIMMAEGGKVPLMLSPGEKLLDPNAVKAVAEGASPMAMGKEVPGKAKVPGAKNSYANDTVKAEASPGSVVLPRSVTQAKDKDAKARAFVEAILSKNKTLPKK